ncbi:MAG TPA: ABC transporter permease [Verrucomicrobiae bacterium]|jgi:lipoprotein-releasing system permease protein|nr:ABC transporter permease [Verrucomicrobiae bacterium]
MSKLPFELLLALRYLRPKRTFVSIITLISILGVALGVAVLIIVISVMSGFDHDLREKILGFNAHLKIFARGTTMQNYADMMSLVSSNKNVRGVAPFVLGQVLVETEPANTNTQSALTAAPWLRGVDVNAENSVSVLQKKIEAGSFDLSGRGLVIGKDFAENMNLSVGDRLSISSPNDLKKMRENYGKPGAEIIMPDDYTVTGIFDMGYYEYDANVIVTSLENAQELYNLDDSVHGLMVMLNDPYQAAKVRSELQQTLGQNFYMTTWMEDNSTILNALLVEKNVMFYLLFFIVLVAALCILSAQIMFVVQKTREIGMLKALGATRLQISSIFLFQSAIIGFIGVASGFGLGMLAVIYRNNFLHFMRHATGWELFPASIYGFGELPAVITPHDIAIICGCSFVICILGGVLPAILAGRLKPVEALRYE